MRSARILSAQPYADERIGTKKRKKVHSIYRAAKVQKSAGWSGDGQ